MQKTQTKKSRATVLLNLVRVLKWKLKSVLYHSKICSGCSIPEVMSWTSCLGRPCHHLPVLFCLSHLGCFVQAFLFWLSCPQLSCLVCPSINVLAALSWQWCASSPVLALLSACPVLDVLFWLSCSGWIYLPVQSSCPVLAVFSAVLSSLSCPGCPFCAALMAVLFC